jgi:hypothetical protein
VPAPDVIALGFALIGCGGSAFEPSPSAADKSLALVGEGVALRGSVRLETDAIAPQDLSIALRWVIEETLFPTDRTGAEVSIEDAAAGKFALQMSARPPENAVVANEATGRDGVAVAYVGAYVDGPSTDQACVSTGDCDHVQVGASPNTLVVYASEPWPSDGPPLFGFNGAPGVRPAQGWSLVNLTPTGCESRPVARAWSDTDTIELVIIGDLGSKPRCEARRVQPDVD